MGEMRCAGVGKRNPNGMGTVVKRSDGRYQAAVYVYTATGHRQRKYVYGHTWEEVNDKRLKLLGNNRKGVPSVESSMLLKDYLLYWLDVVASHELRVSTFSRYSALINDYIVPHLGHRRLNRLSVGDVRRFLADLAKGKGKGGKMLSGRTRQFVHAVLRSALQHAVREEMIGRNVARLVAPPKAETAEIKPLDKPKAEMLIEHADKHWLRAAWLILLATGLRRGEVLGLAWSDVDLTARSLRVRRTLQKIDGEYVFGEPKSKRSRRVMRLPLLCVEALRRHPDIAAERALPAQWRPLPRQPADLIFVTRTGRPVDPRTFNRAFERLCRRAGIDPTRPAAHLRHLAAHGRGRRA
ncbi:MAG: tyrosine-type recombinase/integrase [Pseudonocardiaceae bacterium]|nr:tyrosine-type recombinase/integrase [Pseudonocardiaceae bacterium]